MQCFFLSNDWSDLQSLSGRPAVRLITFLVLCLCLLQATRSGFAQDEPKQDEPLVAPSLGVTNTIEQIVLPGTELTHKTVDPAKTPLIVRVVESFPHGEHFRYDISYFGMTEGEYDLRDFLVRKDGSSTDDLPTIPVRIESILEAGQIEPNELEIGGLSRFGGYWRLVIFGGLFWLVVLVALVIVGRKRKQSVTTVEEKPPSLAELLKPSIDRAVAGTLPSEKFAELERFLFSLWQKRLGLESLETADAWDKIRNHEVSGPLFRQIETWLHGASDAASDIDVADLLKPYQDLYVRELDLGPGLDPAGPAEKEGDSS